MGEKTGRKGRAAEAAILKETDPFCFDCHPGLPCFTKCCADVTIFLTPYDIIRVRRALGLSSGNFLKRHTHSLAGGSCGFPLVALKMNRGRNNRCPFVGPSGCRIYDDRPWSCRMYPLDRTERISTYRLVADRDRCLGLREKNRRTVREWISSQGVSIYNHMERPFEYLVSDPRVRAQLQVYPRIHDMVYMALYDLDRFRGFVFESGLLEIFDLEERLVEAMKEDDLELLGFAYKWLRFGLVSMDALKLRS